MFRMLRCKTLATLAMFSLACGDGQSGPGPFNNLVFTRGDGSSVSFRQDALQFVWCGPWDTDVPIPSLRIVFGGPAENDPKWMLSAVIADVTIGEALEFPTEFVLDQPKGAALFVADPPNELYTGVSGSDGAVTFQKLDCTIGGEVEFSIDAIIASELHNGPPIGVAGNFRAYVEETPVFGLEWKKNVR